MGWGRMMAYFADPYMRRSVSMSHWNNLRITGPLYGNPPTIIGPLAKGQLCGALAISLRKKTIVSQPKRHDVHVPPL